MWIRRTVGAGIGLVVVAAAILFSMGRIGWTERSFMPGPLGRERGVVEAKPAKSAFQTRHLGGVVDSDKGEWARRNGLGPPVAFSHNLSGVFPPELFGQHPEFFPEENGRRIQPPPGSGFWNPDLGRVDVALYAAAAASRHFKAHPEAESFPLGVNDGLTFGESAETRAWVTPPRWFRGRPDYSPLVFTFMNRAATELARTHPDKYLGALAYYWAEQTPGFPVHPQVLPFLTADRSQGYDEAARREELALQQRWGEAGPKRLGLYDYLYGYGFLIPRQHPHLIAESLRHARRAGFTDYYAEMTPSWGLDGPMPWLVAQLLLDPEQNATALLDEYYRRYFKETAEPMRRFFERCEARWMGQAGGSYWLKHYRNESQAALFPPDARRDLRGFLAEAERTARSEIVRQRVRFVSAAFGVTERFTAMKEARDALNRAALGREADWAMLVRGLETYLKARNEFLVYTESLKKNSPLAIAPFLQDDYLKHDPSVQAVDRIARLAEAGNQRAVAGEALNRLADPWVAKAWAATEVSGVREVLPNGSLAGPTRPGRSLAGLDYGVALPMGWQSKVEPAEHHRAAFLPGEPRVLRVEGSKDTAVFQWTQVQTKGFHWARVQLRGRVAPSVFAALTLGWLDMNHRHLGYAVIRLPEGEWPDWVEITQGALPPEGAFFVGVAVGIQHQPPGEAIEVKAFSLTAAGR